jgi:uncharacterized protein YigE (DUF2233 family)
MRASCGFLVLMLALLAISPAAGSSHRAQDGKEKNGPHGDCPIIWQSVSAGLSYRKISCLGDEADVDVHAVRIDPAIWQFDTVIVPPTRALEVARQFGVPFSINAGFFDKAHLPEGLLVRSGIEVQPPRQVSWQGLFIVTEEGEPKIVAVSKWPAYRKRAYMAVQSGPRLVIAGKLNTKIFKSYPAARSGVCLQKSGSLIFFVTPSERKFDMNETAKIAATTEDDGGLECYDALLFDGGHSTQMYVGSLHERLSTIADKVPAFIVGRPRPPQNQVAPTP